MTEARIARLNSLIAQLRSIGPHSNGQNKFILDESPLDNQNQASSSSSRIFIGRLQPNSGIYTQGSILIHIELGPAFPFKPPRVCLRTKVFHPNVSEQGYICIDILNKETSWTATTSLALVVEKTIEIMDTPSLDMIENVEAATLYDKNRQEYERIATDTFNRNCSQRF